MTYGEVDIPWYGGIARVDVIFDRAKQEDLPSDNQIEAFTQFMQLKDSFFSSIEEELFRYFNTAREESDLDSEIKNRVFPKIETPRELKSLISKPTIFLSFFDGKKWSEFIGILIDCIWEEEHGLGVRVVNGKIVEIGLQDIIV